ncbi:tetratricopeptide repeat protein [Grimontia sp. NTOU-MAR1]|uniref:tetratricopeptide repeat protein n=1 Tax=Grimontia sp. NTOU-MAR1 TaxID=3111011 RepID=UPI002DB74EE4|nr:tetratricopeptide repeat protein [Grimontia sp. NTOU-MAR1]WRV98058.1 tetratricopeptide repeat protein [Grimontia sp. NTOU-MAR1]
MGTDKRGLVFTGTDDAGVEQFEAALEWIFDYRPNAMEKIETILEAYPEFVMAHVLKGYSIASEGRHSSLVKVVGVLNAIESLHVKANSRERQHISALQAYQRGDIKAALELWAGILNEWPLDLVAFRQSTGNLFWLGERQRLVDTAAKIAPHWCEDTPGYGYFIGAFSFALEEIGEYGKAEEYARRAVELNPADVWAIHSLAHVLEMNARTDEGIDWIESRREQLPTHNAFVGHIWWHLALFHLEQGNIDEVFSLLDEHIYPEPSNFYLSVQNGASLLKRLEFLGIDVGDRWQRLYEGVKDSYGDYIYLFTELHSAMVLHRAGDKEAISSLKHGLSNPNALRYPFENGISQQLVTGIEAFENGNFAHAASLITPIRYDMARLGGSHAQQDILHQYLINAEVQQGHLETAKGFLKERVSRRTHWDLAPEIYLKKHAEIERLTLSGEKQALNQLLRRVL